MPEKYVRRDGLPLMLRHTGPTTLPERPPRLTDREVVVCLHDAGLQSSVFGDLLEVLGQRRGDGGVDGVAFDWPGHGRSGHLDSLPSIEAMAEMARWLSDWCGVERALLVGHGMGALVALEWARTHPDSIAGLVLCGVGLALGVDEEAIETMRRVTQGKVPRPFDPSRISRSAPPDVMRRAYMEGIQTDPRATLGDLEACHRWVRALDASGTQIACPARILHGEHEAFDWIERADALAKKLAGAETRTVERSAHLLPLERPDALADALNGLREAA